MFCNKTETFETIIALKSGHQLRSSTPACSLSHFGFMTTVPAKENTSKKSKWYAIYACAFICRLLPQPITVASSFPSLHHLSTLDKRSSNSHSTSNSHTRTRQHRHGSSSVSLHGRASSSSVDARGRCRNSSNSLEEFGCSRVGHEITTESERSAREGEFRDGRCAFESNAAGCWGRWV